FADVDVDRYQVNGDQRVVMISSREVSQNGIPPAGKTWQNEHLVYTHGFGAVASQVKGASSQGQPVCVVENSRPQTRRPDLRVVGTGQRVYFGEISDVPYVVVNTGQPELDYQSDTRQVNSPPYIGSGGITVGGILGKLLFAWRFKDVNLLISGLIHNDS